MIKIDQQDVSSISGDCTRASVASVLELDIQAVPHFIKYDNWFSVMYYYSYR